MQPVSASAPASSAMALAEALVAMLCHDLSSPVGAVINALELAEEEPAAAAEALLLARQAAVQIAQRLDLLRAAWAGISGPVSRAGLAELATGLPPRVSVKMDNLTGRSFDGPTSRMLLQAMLLGAAALPRGGVVALAGDGADRLTAQPIGARAAWPERLVAELENPRRMLAGGGPATALAPVLSILAELAGFRASWLPPAAAAPLACPALLLARLT